MVAAYASAGFRTLHLDASMRLGGDPERLDEAVAARLEDWQPYYQGDALAVKRMQLFSYSDRVRYYWGDPEVAREAVAQVVRRYQLATGVGR